MQDQNESGDNEDVVEDQSTQGDNEGYTDEEFDALLSEDDDESVEEDESDDSEEEADESSEEESNEEEEESASVSDDVKLASINETFDTNYRSLEEAKKAQNKKTKLAKKSKNSDVKKDTSGVSGSDMDERMLKMQYPESVHVLDKLKDFSAKTGDNILDVYESNQMFQDFAKKQSESDSVNASNSKKVNKPSSSVGGAKSVDYSRMTSEQFASYKSKVLTGR